MSGSMVRSHESMLYRGCHAWILFINAAHHHAKVFCLDDYPNTFCSGLIACAIWLVKFSCVCRRRANISTIRGILESPMILPLGI